MRPQGRGRRAVGSWARAAPRVTGLAVGLVLMLRADFGVWSSLGLALFLLSLPWGDPAAWWRYVRMGREESGEPEEPCSGDGDKDFMVVLRAAGSRSLDVVKAVRELTGVAVGEAKRQVDLAPTTIATGLSEAKATRLCERLEQAGATAIVVRGPES